MQLPSVIIPPQAEPVTVQEAKDQLRLEGSLDDADINRMIKAARRRIEKVCWRGLLVQALELTMPGFYDPSDTSAALPPSWAMQYFTHKNPIGLRGGHLSEVADIAALTDPAPSSPVLFVKYINEAGVLTTLSPSAYEVDKTKTPGVIRPLFGTNWPTTRDTWNAVQIRYAVGWSRENLPEDLQQAVLILTAQIYEGREGEQLGGDAFNALIDAHRLVRIGG